MSREVVINPALFRRVRMPLEQAETLPASCYYAEEFYKAEIDNIFMKVWNFIGHVDYVPNPGDYYTLEFVGVPIILIRDQQGQVRAFANTCRHRGCQIVEGSGNCKAFVCPYHGWTYALNGDLLSAPEMHLTKDFRQSFYGLKPIRLEIWEGFIFVNFDPTAGSLSEYLGDLPETLASYRFGDMRMTRRVEYMLSCNWKIYVENAMEAYHVPMVHMRTLHKQKRETPPPVPSKGNWVGLHVRHQGSRALLTGDTGFPPIKTLSGLAAQGSYYTLIYPSTMFGCTVDCMWWLELHPQGPEKTRLIVGSCFPSETVARADFNEVVQRYDKRWNISIPEDNAISELQQKGIRSPLAESGRLSHMEPLVHSIANWVLDKVLDGR
ncbi:MAG TPA: aromatic ring-hydroxylating dioxygenase subunit alpha [Alphaproteobacteria bacterium]|nr:aromatic ring-hydroxylating dioxygenase subunit alpha [Alphaproteobacteria bacterium]